MDLGRAERRDHPWLMSLAALVLVSVAATFVLPGLGSYAFRLGQNMGWLLLPFVAFALIARQKARDWRLVLVVGVVVFATILAVAAGVRVGMRATAGTTGSGETGSVEPGRSSGERSISAPSRVGEWRARGDAATRELLAAHIERMESAPEGLFEGAPEAAMYSRRGGDTVVLVGVGVGTELKVEVTADPAAAARDALEGATGDMSLLDMEPGDLGGGFTCTDDGKLLPAGMIVCNWVDADTFGQILMQGPGLMLANAVPLAREFRAAATVTD